jgi:DNA-directed RNA polymerase subunit beta'
VPVGYINELLTKKSLRDIIGNVVKETGIATTAKFLDDIKDLGFSHGISKAVFRSTLVM